MARAFTNSIVTPHRGTPALVPVKFCDARAVRLDFEWSGYGADLGGGNLINPGVRFDVSLAPQRLLDSVQGVYIDNTDVSSPVYLVAQDTGHTVVCPDGSTGFFPVLTGGTEFVLYIESIQQPRQNKQMTRVIVCDRPFPSYTENEFNEFVPVSQISGDEAYAQSFQADRLIMEFYGSNVTTASAFRAPTMTLVPAETRFDTTLIINSIVARTGFMSVASERVCDLYISHGPFDDRAYLTVGRVWGRPYGQAVIHPKSELANLTGISHRLNGRKGLFATLDWSPLISGTNTAGTIVAEINVAYTLVRTPTV